MAGHWPRLFFCKKKKEQDQFPAILIEQACSIRDCCMEKEHYFLVNQVGNPVQGKQRHLSRSGSQSQARIRFILPAQKAYCIINLFSINLS